MHKESFDIPVDVNGLVRESTSKALLANDIKALRSFKLKQQQNKVVADDINTLRGEVNEMKSLLLAVIKKLENKNENI